MNKNILYLSCSIVIIHIINKLHLLNENFDTISENTSKIISNAPNNQPFEYDFNNLLKSRMEGDVEQITKSEIPYNTNSKNLIIIITVILLLIFCCSSCIMSMLIPTYPSQISYPIMYTYPTHSQQYQIPIQPIYNY